MKTNVEIKEWLESQGWYSNFINNCNGDDKITEGMLEENTMVEAFNWDDSPEGYDFWNNVNRKFMDFLGK